MAALCLLLAGAAAAMAFVAAPATARAFATHGEGLLRDGSQVMHDLAQRQTQETTAVLVDLIRHTATARQRALEDLPLELYGGDVAAIRAAIATEDDIRRQRQLANVTTLRAEMERRSGAAVDDRLGELGVRQKAQTDSFADALRRDHVFFVALVLGVLVVVLGFGVHALVVRPTLRLRSATRRVTGGDLEVGLPRPSGDELGDLTGDFADMVRQLRESRAALERLTAGLADEVRRKTEHLERALSELRSSHRQLAEAERLASLGTLAGGIAHEFHNLIGGIRGCAAELAADETSEDRRETFAVIARATDRATGIVQQLLRFARRSIEVTDEVDVATVVEDALRLCEPAARRQDVRVERRLAAGLRVTGDANGLHQVLVNLLTNALQAMPGGGTLAVGSQRDGADVVLTVADTGSGIAAEHLAHVFEPFFTTKGDQHDPARRGSGLGLSVSWGIVTAHGGRIVASSPPGAGATFTVTLPARVD
ncbi:MAG: HAMP domain-containing protein [Planctomycetes bacterium]|nr:HAMP domain-containing protein [Planctomycetota bacterium]